MGTGNRTQDANQSQHSWPAVATETGESNPDRKQSSLRSGGCEEESYPEHLRCPFLIAAGVFKPPLSRRRASVPTPAKGPWSLPRLFLGRRPGLPPDSLPHIPISADLGLRVCEAHDWGGPRWASWGLVPAAIGGRGLFPRTSPERGRVRGRDPCRGPSPGLGSGGLTQATRSPTSRPRVGTSSRPRRRSSLSGPLFPFPQAPRALGASRGPELGHVTKTRRRAGREPAHPRSLRCFPPTTSAAIPGCEGQNRVSLTTLTSLP